MLKMKKAVQIKTRIFIIHALCKCLPVSSLRQILGDMVGSGTRI